MSDGATPPIADGAAAGQPVLDQSGSTPLGTMPAPAYSDISGVRVLCNIRGADRRETELCAQFTARAAQGATMPIEALSVGDPGVLDPAQLIIIVHGAVERVEGRDVLAFSMRPFRNGGTQTVVLFGAAPRAVPLDDPDQLARAMDAAFDEVLPWRSPPAVRPIN